MIICLKKNTKVWNEDNQHYYQGSYFDDQENIRSSGRI